MIWFPSNGSQITAAENVTNNNNPVRNNDTSIITYHKLGNPFLLGHSDIKNLIKKVLIARKHYGCILQLDVFHINTRYRRFIDKIQENRGKSIGVRYQQIWITTQVQIIFEDTYF